MTIKQTDLFDANGLPICPRCLGYIPENSKPGAHQGAQSRTDNRTEVCTPCGVEESMEDERAGTYRQPSVAKSRQDVWPYSRRRTRFAQVDGALRAAVPPAPDGRQAESLDTAQRRAGHWWFFKRSGGI